ncbi:MAG TPA: hypothetical protein VMX38_10810 [Verrucomicrobiae bacterium]|nr:hypothetical protein [Verrucomicrobiae bacterium]
MKIFGAKRTKRSSSELYASRADFCRIFEDHVDRLYLLSLLLTADPELAEKCFVRGLEDSKKSNPVFKEWAQSWARRTIITNAIRMIGPRPGISSPFTRGSRGKKIRGLPEKLASIIELPQFERFVFVMSVLEGYAARDCRLLLNCSNFDVAQGRVQALQQLTAWDEVVRSAETFEKKHFDELQHDAGNADLELGHAAVAQFAASA